MLNQDINFEKKSCQNLTIWNEMMETECPTLPKLLQQLAPKKMQGLQKSLVQQVAQEVMQLTHSNTVPWRDGCTFEHNPQVMDRIVLYRNSVLEIRIHLFMKGASETFIHNHGQDFATFCVSGSYQHKLYKISQEKQILYHKIRLPGGTYGDTQITHASIEQISNEPFSKGNVLIVAADDYHSVEAKADETVTTIVFKRVTPIPNHVTRVLSKDKHFGAPMEKIIPISINDEKQALLDRFFDECQSHLDMEKKEFGKVCNTQ